MGRRRYIFRFSRSAWGYFDLDLSFPPVHFDAVIQLDGTGRGGGVEIKGEALKRIALSFLMEGDRRVDHEVSP